MRSTLSALVLCMVACSSGKQSSAAGGGADAQVAPDASSDHAGHADDTPVGWDGHDAPVTGPEGGRDTQAGPDTSDAPAGSPDTASPSGPPWRGIIDPSRAIDWSHAGVTGGIPARTTICSTLNPGASAAQINATVKACPTGQVVMLSAGTYNISDDGIVMKSGVTLRGAGADQTLLIFTAVNYCNNQNACICFAGSNEWGGDTRALPGGTNAADWTGGYAQGSTQITLANVGSAGVQVGQYLHLDQANDQTVGSNFFVCDTTQASCSLEGGNGGRTISDVLRSQVQIVQITATNGSTYTIDPPLYSPNWRASQSPGAWWPSVLLQNAGVEDLSVDATNSGGSANIAIVNAANDWVKGVRVVRSCQCQRDLIELEDANHCTIESNYLYGTEGQSVNYGIESYVATDNLIQNNIFQHVVAPMMVQPALGSVLAYNFAVNNTYRDSYTSNPFHWMECALAQHNGGVEYNLYEGNVVSGFSADLFHGTQLANTLFRNYLLGTDPGRTDATTAITILSYNRYHNVVGNVLGTPGYTTTYEANAGPGQTATVYNLGSGNTEGSVTIPADPLVKTTLLRWGNWDVASGSTHFDPAEVPSTISPLGNAVPGTQSLPPSFFLAAKPDFWPSTVPWPPVGPELTGGNLAGLGGHANRIPAQECFSKMGGPADGSGSVLAFSRTACYP